ncbi:AraC family transcriptional regulator [Bartonella sp. HY329]|uniref:helix-turn-helix transcriptional regulator n=1 Tax=unclassified Bartonella TaxID=2645622 RepID=UPI0021CA969A|nr:MULTISPECIES: AraC family transcriptional regulator [unclassified Bartonella]UXM95942.1 AraC family transcriptional regulator [Bartonella sp. HY329]UXN10267.1 AraC family transcriptional regulator [Bartonella sp. HY328]
MSFHPQMECQIGGIKLIDKLKYRILEGAIIDVWTVECGPNMQGHYLSRAPRLFFVLENSAEISFFNNHDNKPNQPLNALDLCYIPANCPVSSHLTKSGFLKHLDIHFDIDLLQQHFEGCIDTQRINQPNLFFQNPRIAQIANLLAQECNNQTPLHNLFSEGLLYALVAELFQITHSPLKRSGTLSQRQLKQVTQFIENNYDRIIRIEELANICGLSKSYFCTAFKMTTGISPLSFQMQRRIKKAKLLLEREQRPLSDIATTIGFSDQAHFTRVFKKINGTTPKEWVKIFN